MLEQAKIVSKSLKVLNIKKGDIITVKIPNIYQGIILFLAANRIGATVTFLSFYEELEEDVKYISLYQSKLFMAYAMKETDIEQLKAIKCLKHTILIDCNDYERDGFNQKREIKKIPFAVNYFDLNSYADIYTGLMHTCHDTTENALILYTSGTTGTPKSVVLTNNNLMASAIYMKNSTHLPDVRGEKSFVGVPFTYPYGFATSTLMSLLCGRQVVLAPDLSSRTIEQYIRKNLNVIFGSPALLELIKRNIPDNQDLSSVNTFISGGDFLQESQIKEARQFFCEHGCSAALCNGSGNAETAGASTNHVGIEIRENTVGKILAGTYAVVIDSETQEEKKYGEEGLLCVGGKHVFKGYYNEKELTEDAFITFKGKKYLKTGTRGYLDQEGYFTLTGRDSRFYIISSLNKVYCDRVQMIMSHIDVIDSIAVVKKNDKERLFVGKAFIVLKPEVPETEETWNYILDKCSKPIVINKAGEKVLLKTYEIPECYEFIGKLPRTVADKIDYKSLEEK